MTVVGVMQRSAFAGTTICAWTAIRLHERQHTLAARPIRSDPAPSGYRPPYGEACEGGGEADGDATAEVEGRTSYVA